KDLGEMVGIPDLRLSESGGCSLVFDGRINVQLEFEPETGKLTLFSPLGPIPEHDRETFFARLLAANLFGKGTGGSVLSIDQASNTVVLAGQTPVKWLESVDFQSLLQRFVDTAEHWMSELQQPAPEPETPESPAGTFIKV